MIEKQPSSAKAKTVKVTFALPADVAQKSVAIVGDFNDWDKAKDQMKLAKGKDVWSKTLTLKKGSSYQFRYYIDEEQWRNDEKADRYASNPFFSENGVIDLEG